MCCFRLSRRASLQSHRIYCIPIPCGVICVWVLWWTIAILWLSFTFRTLCGFGWWEMFARKKQPQNFAWSHGRSRSRSSTLPPTPSSTDGICGSIYRLRLINGMRSVRYRLLKKTFRKTYLPHTNTHKTDNLSQTYCVPVTCKDHTWAQSVFSRFTLNVFRFAILHKMEGSVWLKVKWPLSITASGYLPNWIYTISVTKLIAFENTHSEKWVRSLWRFIHFRSVSVWHFVRLNWGCWMQYIW